MTSYPNFRYCVWLLPDDEYLYNINRQITPHISVKTNLSLADAINLHNNVYKDINHTKIHAKIDDNFLISNDNGLTSLYYNVLYGDPREKPVWWPDDARMSFIYKYNEGITENEKIYMNIQPIDHHTTFRNPCITLCDGHYGKWDIIKM